MAKNQVRFMKFMVQPQFDVTCKLLNKKLAEKIMSNLKSSMSQWQACKWEEGDGE